MKAWYHCECMFETLQRARTTTKKIETPADLDGFPSLQDTDKDNIKQCIKGLLNLPSYILFCLASLALLLCCIKGNVPVTLRIVRL